MKLFRPASALLPIFLLAACQSSLGPSPSAISAARATMLEEIKNEPSGAWFVGRRYFKTDYKFWGFVRASGQPWSAAKLVVLNENQKPAPDRTTKKLGSDNNFEYRLNGYYSGDTVYEPASNGFYPEFVLKGYELRYTTPAPIYREPTATNPDRRVIAKPY
ncbi:MAG: hypothetical protein ACKVYV_11635 [Limisphaerales bacterium]